MDPRTVLLMVCCTALLLPIPGVHAATTSPPQSVSTEITSTSATTTTPSTTTTPRSGNCDNDSGVGRGIGIGIGIMLCIVAAVVGLLVFWLWRRGWTLPCNTDLASKHVEHGDTSGSVVHVKTEKTYGRQKPENNQPSDGKGAATTGNYSSFHAKEDNPSYDALQRTLSQKSEVYEDPEKSQAAKRQDSARPPSDMYEDPEKSAPDNRVSENYEEPVALVKRGSGKAGRLSERVPPEGKRQSQADDEQGEIYENTDSPPPPRPTKGKGSNSDKKAGKGAPEPPAGDNDDLYIDMNGGAGRADSIYMNTD